MSDARRVQPLCVQGKNLRRKIVRHFEVSTRRPQAFLYHTRRSTYTASVLVRIAIRDVKQRCVFLASIVLATMLSTAQAQQPSVPNSKAKQYTGKPAVDAAAQTPAQIELLETHIRFEADGSSRKEVHTRVRINTELGTRQFARLSFDYNRAFETVEIPLARITHASGGTADILPSAVSDQVNPAVAEASAYQDVRRKTVRILGLQPTDQLEYRVMTTTKAPLAPDFYLFHTFAKDAIVAEEKFELDLPSGRAVRLRVNPSTPPKEESKSGDAADPRIIRQWEYRWASPDSKVSDSAKQSLSTEPDVALTTFTSWNQLSATLAGKFSSTDQIAAEVIAKSADLTKDLSTPEERIQAIYDFVSLKIATLALPMEATEFRARNPAEIISSGYATEQDKMLLFTKLIRAAKLPAIVALAGAPDNAESLLPRPSMFTHVLAWCGKDGPGFWLDPSVEVAPFRMVAANLRGKPAFLLLSDEKENIALSRWLTVPVDLPFAASQHVDVEATLSADGKLFAKVHYALRGDNELLLRVAFRQTAKEKWQDLAQLLSISDGFRGKVDSVSASDPTVTREPFAVDYQITMPKFVDWSKKPVRIPALLPQVGLPDAPAKIDSAAATSAIDLGTPLDVQTRATLHLPPGTAAHTPTGTSVERDYATFSSKYSAREATVTASRHVNFLLRTVPAERVADYKAFMHAVQNDEAQDFVLERPDSGGESSKPAVKKTAAHTNP
jgi:transglutaminase-like putative cysteine protease